MKKQHNPWIFISFTILTVFNLLVYFAIRAMWSGIVRYTFKAMPYYLLATIIVATLTMMALCIMKKYPKWILFIIIPINLLFLGLDAYIISLTTEATHYFIREFMYGLAFISAVSIVPILWNVIINSRRLHERWVPVVMLIVLFIVGVIWQYDICLINDINTPVVYAVEDTYQIVFTTKAKGEAWVIIDGVEYNDTFAGYRYTEEKIHKVSVPMEVLDKAKKYKIETRAMYLRGPYESLQGKTISQTYNWKGVNLNDGLDYYVLADTHNTQKTPLAAASYFGDKLDFLIAVGDHVSWVDREADLSNFLTLGGNITNGEIPVIYARGNHETKGVMADELHRYVGARDEDYYYTFRIQNIWGIVLDIGEDHADDFVEYCGTSKFDPYREQQTLFLDEVIANAENEYDAEGVEYRIAVSHIPLTVKSKNDYVANIKDAWVERLNQMNITILYSGHQHELWFIDDSFEAGSTLTQVKEYSGKDTNNSTRIMTNTNFPSILVSKRGEAQSLLDPEKVFDTGFIGLAVSVKDNETIMRYTNDHNEIVGDIRSPWFSNIVYGDEIRITNK
ncbi:MAG: metallophosphoesterase [Erysipelotrichales bacterium]|nr:metallophosphoesterase [Erysipelotrichales bacterium]